MSKFDSLLDNNYKSPKGTKAGKRQSLDESTSEIDGGISERLTRREAFEESKKLEKFRYSREVQEKN